MAKKPRYLTGAVYRATTALDAATLPQLDQIAPDNISEAIRFCIQFALERGALAAALAQHTPQQRAAWLERYHQPQPVVQLYNGQPIPAAGHTIAQAHAIALEAAPAAPAPQPMEVPAAQMTYDPEQINTTPPPSTSAPILAAVQQAASLVSPADMLAYAHRFCSDDDLDAARLELEQMEAAARKQRDPL